MQEKYCGSSLSTAAQFLRQVSGFDLHADPHGETSGRKQWRQEGQRALISEQKVLKTSGNCSFYSFSTFRNQQVAGSSPATSSNPKTSKVLKYQGFRGFSFFTFGAERFQKLSTVVYWLLIFDSCPNSCSPRFLLIRYMKLPAAAVVILQKCLEWQHRQSELLGDKWSNPDGLVFTNEFGSYIHPDTLTHWFTAFASNGGQGATSGIKKQVV